MLDQELEQLYLNFTIFNVLNMSATCGAERLVAARTDIMPHCGENMKFTGVHIASRNPSRA
jgi:hypothetical protein